MLAGNDVACPCNMVSGLYPACGPRIALARSFHSPPVSRIVGPWGPQELFGQTLEYSRVIVLKMNSKYGNKF